MHGTFRATEVRPARGREIRLRPLHPNAGLTAAYRAKLEKLIDDMHASVVYWVEVRYRNNEPLLAMDDALPANALKRAVRELARRWQGNINAAAPELARYFAKAARRRTDAALRSILKQGGFSVEFTMTREMRDVLNATIEQNVSLIKSIPEQYLKSVQGAVMRSVQTGRDLGALSKELQESYGVTKRRAAVIARSQNNLATAAMNRARQDQLGITKAKWRHSGAGKHPRPTHVKNNGRLYDVKKGWRDPATGRYIWPGTEPGCKCVSVSVIPGFS